MNRPAATSRAAGLDLARAAVIIGMFAIHFYLPAQGETVDGFGWRQWAPIGGLQAVRVGFPLVAGIALALSASAATTTALRRWLLVRAAIFLPLGLALQELDPEGVAVILQNLALLFLLAMAIVEWSDRALLWAAATSAATTFALTVGYASRPEWFHGGATRLWDDPGTTLAGLLATGAYPVIVLLCPFLLGVWMGRRGPDLVVDRRTMVAASAALAALAVWHLAAEDVLPASTPDWLRLVLDPALEPFSPTWLAAALAGQTLLLGLCLALARRIPRAITPLVALGRIALSAYVAHLLVIAIDPAAVRSSTLSGTAWRTLAATVFFALFGAWWLRRHRRGPLEGLVHAIAGER